MPWYLLAALTLGRHGHRVFMHGMHRKDERIYTLEAIQQLGLQEAECFDQASSFIEQIGFAYMDISKMSLLTSQLIAKRDLLGLRPPLHTVARMLNPYNAPVMLQSVFHPNYAEVHQQAAQLLGQPRAIAFKGEGGEIERIPERSVTLYGLSDDGLWQEQWPNLLPADKYQPAMFPDWHHFRAVWEGDVDDLYATAAITGTLALALRAMGEFDTVEQAQQRAEHLWQTRQQPAANSLHAVSAQGVQ